MSAHLTPVMLSCLADDELSLEELAAAQQHLETCPACTSKALGQTLLKRAVARSGYCHVAPADLAERIRKQLQSPAPVSSPASSSLIGTKPVWATAGWAAALLLAVAGIFLVQSGVRHSGSTSVAGAALLTEVCDLHVAALAATSPPQVVSTDRHTVKPWFQGKLPFSFNLPQDLPADVTLEGANLTYLQGQPVAQLLYRIGRHHASVFLRQKTGANLPLPAQADRSGFHVTGLSTYDLQMVAVSDADSARLTDLAGMIAKAQPQGTP